MARSTDPDSLSLKPSSAAVRGERARPDFSGVRGGADTVPGTPPPTGGQRYTIKPGDTLSHIAQRYYGNASDWRRIYEANRGTIKDPDLIHPGQEITIPPANET